MTAHAKPGAAAPVAANTVAANHAKPVAAPAAATAAPPEKRRNGRFVLMAAVPLVLVAAGAWFYLTGGRYEDTDNAYLQQAKVAISADVAGRIAEVSVTENAAVKAGDLLFSIDPQPFEIALEQDKAALASARVNVEQLRVAHAGAEAALKSAQATLDLQQASYDRQAALVGQGVASSASLDVPKLSLQQAENAVVAATQQVAAAVAALGGDPAIATDDHPAVRSAMAEMEQAERNLAKTRVLAPADGVLSQVSSLNVGQFVAAGTTIASLVEVQSTWVEANFKETQLGSISIGMPAEVKVDAYPARPLAGKVASIGAATGSEFSLIPAQNATGNWVKVVQRIPVRIEFDTTDETPELRSGMSAEVRVDSGHSTLDRMQGH
jgi:membrane fusion protein, multidrug efflux system